MMSEEDGFPFGTLARVPGLVIRLGFSFLKFKRRVKKNTRKLKRGLVKNGMSRERAKELANKYEEDLSIRKFMKNAMGDSGLPSFFPFNS